MLRLGANPRLAQAWVQWMAVFAFLCFGFLFEGNMGSVNEVDVLPLARQFANPDWIPQDWYLNQAIGYRFLFSGLVGWMASAWGFLAASIVGRLLCYALISLGLVRIGRHLQLSLPFLLLAIALFLYGWQDQGMIAKEWIVGGLEAKSVAYGLVLLAIADGLQRSDRRMAILLGVATSFHVLVGGWAMLAVAGTWLTERRQSWRQASTLLTLGLLYLGGAVFAIPPVVGQLLAAADPATATALGVPTSFIYVFFRLPHHLNPLSWPALHWLRPVFLLGLLLGSLLWQTARRSQLPRGQVSASYQLAKVVGLSLLPFGVGVVLAPWDTTGKLLQYYPFRLGDVLLPLGALLVAACVLEQSVQRWRSRWAMTVGSVFLVIFGLGQTLFLAQHLVSLPDFPGIVQEVDEDWERMGYWIQRNTALDSRLVAPPVDHSSLLWLSERAIVAHYKFLPQRPDDIAEWTQRLDALTGGTLTHLLRHPAALDLQQRDGGRALRQTLREGFRRLTTEQAIALLQTYEASYLLTDGTQALDLAIAHQAGHYILYKSPHTSTHLSGPNVPGDGLNGSPKFLSPSLQRELL